MTGNPTLECGLFRPRGLWVYLAGEDGEESPAVGQGGCRPGLVSHPNAP